MGNKIHSLGTPTITVGAVGIQMNTDERIVIKTKHGQKFEVIVGKDNLQVRTITDMSTGICVMPDAANSIIIEEKE